MPNFISRYFFALFNLKTKAQYLYCVLFLFSPLVGLSQTIDFSEDRGFKSSSFNLLLSTDLPAATIKYTLDHTAPSATTGLVYSTAININSNSVVRAFAYNSTDTSEEKSYTYLYLSEVVSDSLMRTFITQDPQWSSEIIPALLSKPSIFLTFDDTIGVNVKTQASAEFVFPNPSENFQVNCGIEHYGNGSLRLPKRNIRLHFDEEFGPKNLEADLFSDYTFCHRATKKHDKLDLRTSHDSWLYNPGGLANPSDWALGLKGQAYICTKMADDYMLKGGSFNPHNRYAHVYLNGHYWGQYNLREKFDDNFLANYMGGENEDYDFISGSKVIVGVFMPDSGVLKNGSGSQWYNLVNASNNYAQWKTMADKNSFMDLMLSFMYFTPEAEWNAAGAPDFGKKFQFQVNDADLLWTRYIMWNANRTNPVHNANGPDNMFRKLYQSGDPDFFSDFADRAALHLTENGLLSPATVTQDWLALSDLIDTSIVAESARWADDSTENKTNWRDSINSVSTNYVPYRSDDVLGFLKTEGLYPSIDPVQFSHPSGILPIGTNVTLTNPNNKGDVYFTTDNSDPRALGGTLSPAATFYNSPITIGQGVTEVKARVKSIDTTYNYIDLGINKPISSTGTHALMPEKFANDGRIRGMYYLYTYNSEDSIAYVTGKYEPWIEIDLQSVQQIDRVICWNRSGAGFVNNFEDTYCFVSDQAFSSTATVDLINDPNVDSYQFPGMGGDKMLFETGGIQGRYVRIQIPNKSAYMMISEIQILQKDPTPIIKDVWSPMVPKVYHTSQSHTDIVINEIHYDPNDSISAIDTIAGNNYEFIELKNTGNTSIHLHGMQLNGGVQYKFNEFHILAPGDFFVIAENADRFQEKYGFASDAQFKGQLDNGGEYLEVIDPFGTIADSLTYDDKNGWPSEPDQGVVSLGLKLPSILDNSNEDNWAVQSVPYTPGQENEFDADHDAHPFQLNELQYHTRDSINGAIVIDDDEFEFIELKNTSSTALDISHYFFSRGIEYRFPLNTIIPANDFIVIAKDSTLFHARYGQAADGIYDGKLSNSGEELWLHDKQGYLIDALSYSDSAPWQSDADGTGYSLALFKDSTENAEYDDWDIQCEETTLWEDNKHETSIQLSGNVFEICAIDSIVLNTLEQGLSQGGDWTFNNQMVTAAQNAGIYQYTYINASGCTTIDSVDVTHQIPDYVSTLAIAPSAIVGPKQVRTIVSISEIKNELSCTPVYVLMPKDISRYSFSYLPNALGIGGVSVNNSEWQYYSTNPSFHVWEYIGGDFPALGSKKIGFIGLYNPNNTDGATTFTVQLFGGSGGELNGLNNSDSESLIYFK